MVQLRPLTMAGDLVIDPRTIVGPGIAILGQSGFGKSTTVRRLAEQLLGCPLPFSIMDIEDEYYSIKQIGNVILAGPVGNDVADLDVRIENEQQAYKLARKAYLEQRSVVMLLGELDEDTREEWVTAYAHGLFDAGHNVATRNPYFFIIEECQEYVPQVGADKKNPCFRMLKRISKRGRKRGIFPVWSSQRSADVDKNILTQCQTFFLHAVTWINDMNTYKTLLPVEDLERHLQSMVPGDCYFRQGKQITRTRIVMPLTKSPSVTPGANASVDMQRVERVADADLLQSIINTAPVAEGGVSTIPTVELRQLQAQVPSLTLQLENATNQLASVTTQLNEMLEFSKGDRDLIEEISTLKIEIERIKKERDKFATDAMPLNIIKQMIREDLLGKRIG